MLDIKFPPPFSDCIICFGEIETCEGLFNLPKIPPPTPPYFDVNALHTQNLQFLFYAVKCTYIH